MNLATVFGRGSQDTLMGRAIKRAAAEFSSAAAKGIFRSPEASSAAAGASANTGAKWNGSFNPQASTVCFSYNIQGRTHVASALTDRGACKHNHTPVTTGFRARGSGASAEESILLSDATTREVRQARRQLGRR